MVLVEDMSASEVEECFGVFGGLLVDDCNLGAQAKEEVMDAVVEV